VSNPSLSSSSGIGLLFGQWPNLTLLAKLRQNCSFFELVTGNPQAPIFERYGLQI
jgi:hypothetical protein